MCERCRKRKRPSVVHRLTVGRDAKRTKSVSTALVAIVVAVITTIVSSFVTSEFQLSQYWRDKRLQVYSDYYSVVNEARTALLYVESWTWDVENNGHLVSQNLGLIKEAEKRVDDLSPKLQASASSISLIGGNEAREIADQLYVAFLKVRQGFGVLVFLVEGGGDVHGPPETIAEIRDGLSSFEDAASDGSMEILRIELGVGSPISRIVLCTTHIMACLS